MTLRTLGTALDYDQLLDLVRRRIDELQTRGETVDEVAGLPDGYTCKLLKGARGIGPVSLGPLLATLGLAITLQVNEDYDQRVRQRLERTVSNSGLKRAHTKQLLADAHARMQRRTKMSELASKRWAKTTPEERRQLSLLMHHARHKHKRRRRGRKPAWRRAGDAQKSPPIG